MKGIDLVVRGFYEEATKDILIGYHFRHLEDLDTHLPRIVSFWEIHLLGHSQTEIEKPFDLISLHLPMKIKKGELHRWLFLFRKHLNQAREDNHLSEELAKKWEEKLVFFEEKFLRFLGL